MKEEEGEAIPITHNEDFQVIVDVPMMVVP